MAAESSMQTFVFFIASTDERLLHQITPAPRNRANQYRIDDVIPVAGAVPAGLASGLRLVRVESEAAIQLAAEFASEVNIPIIIWGGVTQHLHYTSDSQRRELDARSHTEFAPSPETTAVLIPIGKSRGWWQLAQDSRQAHFQTSAGYEGHTAIGLRYVDRIFRKLYHSRYVNPSTPYDFLTYFEFNYAHKDDFNTLLRELRDTGQNPEWAYTELEYEIWLTKVG